jgi:LmbE family N-acetylglucosaminyl deacetylase
VPPETDRLLPTEPGTLLVLSPHLDDAALSCGASIARAADEGWRVVVVVFLAGHPPVASLTAAARRYHEECGLGDDAMTVRIREDDAAMAVLAAEPERLGLLEALYRLRPDGSPRYESWSDMYDPPGGPEPEIVSAMTDAMADAMRSHRPSLVLYPLAVGGHVDHLAVHVAALAVQDRDAGVPWFAYGDVPYVQYPWFAGWEDALGDGWRPITHDVADRHWSRKLDAIGCYPSQLRPMFGEPSDWRGYLTAYAQGLTPGDTTTERFWHR